MTSSRVQRWGSVAGAVCVVAGALVLGGLLPPRHAGQVQTVAVVGYASRSASPPALGTVVTMRVRRFQPVELVASDLAATVDPDGSIDTAERLTVRLAGQQEEVPWELLKGSSPASVSVSDDRGPLPRDATQQPRPGLSVTPAPGTFALDSDANLVVAPRAGDRGVRTFTIHEHAVGLTVAASDAAELSLRPWTALGTGTLPELRATVKLPGAASVGGQPASACWVADPRDLNAILAPSAGDSGWELEADDVAADQFVDVDVVFPLALLTSRAGTADAPGTDVVGDVIGGDREARLAAGDVARRQAAEGCLLGLALLLSGLLLTVGLRRLRLGWRPRRPWRSAVFVAAGLALLGAAAGGILGEQGAPNPALPIALRAGSLVAASGAYLGGACLLALSA